MKLLVVTEWTEWTWWTGWTGWRLNVEWRRWCVMISKKWKVRLDTED